MYIDADEKKIIFFNMYCGQKVLNDIRDKVFNDSHDRQICNGSYFNLNDSSSTRDS